MKTSKNYIRLMLVAVMAITTIGLQAQPGPNPEGPKGPRGMQEKHRGNFIPDLTEDQKAQMKELHIANKKETSMLMLDIEEKRIQLKKLLAVESPDMKAVENKLDEIFELKKKAALLKIKNHQEVRNLLTDDQKVVLDMKMKHVRKMDFHHGDRRGRELKKDCS